MRITKVNLNTEIAQKEGGRLLAFGSIDIEDELRIEFVRIVKTHDGRILVCMPSLVNSAGQHKDTVHPLNKYLRQSINEIVFNELQKSI